MPLPTLTNRTFQTGDPDYLVEFNQLRRPWGLLSDTTTIIEPMSEASGEIYFIGETDYLTKERTSFYKIGLVREAEGRDSESRLLEHQTGNPRTLSIECTIKTPLVDYIESLLHGLYASNRVEGEWFHLDATELAAAKSSAENMAAEAEVALPIWIAAAELTLQTSSPDKISPDDAVKQIYLEFLKADSAVKKFKALDASIKKIVKEAFNAGEEIEQVGRNIEVATEKLDQEKFKESYPDLFASFQKVSEKFAQRFVPSPAKNQPELTAFLEGTLTPLTVPIEAAIEAVRAGASPMASLNQTKLNLLAHLAKFDWDAENAKRKLQVFCGTAAGIEGICTWNRAMKEASKLDEDRLKAAHPEEYQSCVVVSIQQRTILQPRQVVLEPGQQGPEATD